MTNNHLLLLRNKGEEPTDAVLAQAMGKELFDVYKRLIDLINNEFYLVPHWRFYEDGKAWLCKIVAKNKTIFWLSVWRNSVKVSFYFTEKTRMGVVNLQINNEIKKRFEETKTKGKFIPLILDIERKDQLKDLKALIAYKQGFV